VTSQAKVVAILFILSLLAGIVTGWDTYYNLSYVWGGLLIISFVWSRIALIGLEFSRKPRTLRAQVGRIYEETIRLKNASRIPKLWVEVHDSSNLPGHRASIVTARMGRRQTKDWLIRTICTRRGRFQIGPVEVMAGDPFGLFPRLRKYEQEYYIVVLPKTDRIRSFPFPSGRLPGGDALRQRTHHITPNAAGVRDYVPGDSLNRIHWRSTARLRRLIVKEFEYDPQAEVWIVFDAAVFSHVGEVEQYSPDLVTGVVRGEFELPRSTEEYGVAISASLALHLLERDRAVGFIAHGKARHVLQSDRGEAQLYHMLESLAVLEAIGRLSLEELVKVEGPMIPRGATVVVITPSTHSEVATTVHDMKRRGLAPVLILIDAQSFGGREGTENLAIAARTHGIPVRIVHYGEPLSEALSQQSPARVWDSAA
jgi:uncharacterized protein (DUF58 family)